MNLIHIPQPQDLTGHILALNPEKGVRFQCGGFQLAIPSRPYATVTHETQQEPVRRALLEGRLIDITNQNLAGLKVGDSFQTPAKEAEEKGHKVYLATGTDGSLLVICPKDEAEEAHFEEQIRLHGRLTADNFKVSDQPLGGLTSRVDSSQADAILSSLSNAITNIKR
jgi:hypothetical protein